MLVSTPVPRRVRRAGAAAVELAVLLPLLVFLCVISVDFARIFYFSQTLANCARNGALYESDPYRAESPYKNVTEAALADASNFADANPKPSVSSTSGTDASGLAYVEVTVSYKFETITHFPGVPVKTTLARTIRMAVAPNNPTY